MAPPLTSPSPLMMSFTPLLRVPTTLLPSASLVRLVVATVTVVLSVALRLAFSPACGRVPEPTMGECAEGSCRIREGRRELGRELVASVADALTRRRGEEPRPVLAVLVVACDMVLVGARCNALILCQAELRFNRCLAASRFLARRSAATFAAAARAAATASALLGAAATRG